MPVTSCHTMKFNPNCPLSLQAYQVLEDNKLSEEQLRLLTPTAMQGQKLSKRQRLSLELAQGMPALT